MKIERNDLMRAAEKSGISPLLAEKLWAQLSAAPSSHGFDLARVLYYFGALLVMLAMSWFVGQAWERFGGQGIFWIGLSYVLFFFGLGAFLWDKKELKTPGGLFITIAVALVPLAVYGLQKWMGWWIVDQPGQYKDFFNWIKGGWFFMEIATIAAGCLALYFYRFPFLTLPIFFTLWFVSMDIAPLIFGERDNIDDIRKIISIFFGMAVLLIAYAIDLKSDRDFAFWPYFFGVATFWGGLSLLDSGSEFTRFVYLLINIALLLLSVLLQRTVFLVFGAIGILLYLFMIFDKYFADSLAFPLLLSLVGVIVVFLGIFYHKYQSKIQATIMQKIPDTLKKWLPRQ